MGDGPTAVMVTPQRRLTRRKAQIPFHGERMVRRHLPAGIGHQSEASFVHYSAALPAPSSLVGPPRLGQEEGPEEANVR